MWYLGSRGRCFRMCDARCEVARRGGGSRRWLLKRDAAGLKGRLKSVDALREARDLKGQVLVGVLFRRFPMLLVVHSRLLYQGMSGNIGIHLSIGRLVFALRPRFGSF